eukprot:scaffold277450_cov33-Prasinocladus_malaysianus.AAC.3
MHAPLTWSVSGGPRAGHLYAWRLDLIGMIRLQMEFGAHINRLPCGLHVRWVLRHSPHMTKIARLLCQRRSQRVCE